MLRVVWFYFRNACPSLIQWICTGELCAKILLVDYPVLKLVNYFSCLSSLYDIYTVQEHGHDHLLTEFKQMCCKVLLPNLTSTCLNYRVPLVYHSHWLGFTRKTLTTIGWWTERQVHSRNTCISSTDDCLGWWDRISQSGCMTTF